MEALSYFGLAAFIMVMGQLGSISKINRKLKKLSNTKESKEKMSRLLNELIGKKCSITDSFMGYQGTVIDCDDDWVKIQVANKKKTIKLCPIDEIQSIEILEDKEKV